MVRFNRQSKKKEKRNKLILGIFVIVVMVGGGLGIANRGDSLGGNSVDYGDFKFAQQQDRWFVKIDGKVVGFYYHPIEIEFIEMDKTITDTIKNAEALYITNDPTSPNAEYIAVARFQFNEVFVGFFSTPVVNTFTKNISTEIPVITCEDATEQTPVIMFTEGNQTEIMAEDNCIVLKAQAQTFNDHFRLADRLLYSLLGVME